MPSKTVTALATSAGGHALAVRDSGRCAVRSARLAAGLLSALLVLSACSDDGGDAAAEVTTTVEDGTTTSVEETTTTGADGEEGDDAADAVAVADAIDAYALAVSTGDLDGAWALVDERSKEAVGELADFEAMGSALSEGIGAWASAEDRTTFVIPVGETGDGRSWAATFLGRVSQEGPPGLAATSMVAYTRDGDATVSPFEGLASSAFPSIVPPAGATVGADATFSVELPDGFEAVAAAVDEIPLDVPEGEASFELAPDEPMEEGDHAVTLVVDIDGDLVALADAHPVTEDGDGGGGDDGDGGEALPASAEEWAEATFAAWRDGDTARLDQLVDPSALDALTGRAWSADDGWPPSSSCDGAAGSVYCQWVAESGEEALLLRISNQAVQTGQPAVIEAGFGPPV